MNLQEEMDKVVEVENENRPTEEDIKRFENDFKEAHEKFKNMPEFIISDDEKVLEIAKYVLGVNRDYVWKNEEFRAINLFNNIMTEKISKIENGEETAFTLDMNAIQWAYIMFTNYSGRGLECAEKFVKEYDIFTSIRERLHECMGKLQDEANHLQVLQDRLAAAYQGFFLVESDGVEDDTIDEDDCAEVPMNDETIVEG